MPSIRWNRRALIVIIFGIVTAVLWILCIWQLVLRYKTETSSPSSLLCGNKGEYKNGRCFCTEEWIGQRCEIVNFCENSIYQVNSSVKFTFTRIIVDRYGYSEEKCNKSTVNAGTPIASRKCSKIGGKPTLDDLKSVDCNTNLKMLKDQLGGPDNISSIASNTQILTSEPEKLTTENISTAADIAGQILKNYSQEATATVAAVATISQLLDARESEFNFADNNLTNITASLTQTLENFSLDGSAVQPNIAVNHISLKPTSTTAFFSAQTVSGSLQSENIKVDENVSDLKTDNGTEVQILINVTRKSSSSGDGSIGFVLYQNDKFFQSKNYKTHFNHAKQIISGHVADGTVVNDVKMVFNPKYDASEMLLHDYACVFWDYSANDWSTTGCTKEGNKTELRCRCNHTTSFAVLMSFKINYKYAKPLEIVSNIGSGFSIAGLVITILFQILTRKTRKFSVTWMLVSLCTSMLIFNIIFIFGIDNSNAKNNTAVSTNNTVLDSDRVDPPENASCTAVAVLLHYFLLATFMWTALNSAHLYLLLVKTLRPIPGHFTLIMSIIGWGVPAVVVAITLGATYREGKQLNYRQEEFCWLAVLDDKGEVSIKKPMIGAFLLVVAVILLFNIIIFVKITVFVMWKENTNLTSNKKKSFTTKIFGTLSIAVVLGITWVLGYMMLINQEATNIVFSILFCIFNATQGLQICILYTFRSPIFKKKVTELFSYVSLPDIPISLHSKTYYLLKFRYKKHTYENFKPSETFSEETSFSSNDQTPTKN
ncbi:adhesion G-protein coupled receptor G7 [Malaclemys terrapin pileata]|uniref:adhesion G-protein coupled receptor G7 n=1 Tax=Malaclemys terrapin pileata TaxID=2991368 RepID=UPI0023A85202|nr:adhesion G-protein coupled receptor G7 [Malaclemys terrapin pileata]